MADSAENLDKWLKLYQSPNSGIQKHALKNIVKCQDPRARQMLLDAFERYAPHGFAQDIVKAIADFKDPQCAEDLARLLEHPDVHLRGITWTALFALRDSRAYAFFSEKLFADEQRHHDFVALWYSRNLFALQEPSLWRKFG